MGAICPAGRLFLSEEHGGRLHSLPVGGIGTPSGKHLSAHIPNTQSLSGGFTAGIGQSAGCKEIIQFVDKNLAVRL